MNKLVTGVITVMVVLGGMLALSKPDTPNTNVQPNLSFATVQQEVTQGAKLYDVRTAEEYKVSRFENANNWSLQDMQSGKLPDVAKDSKIFLYCHSGNRSGQASTLLKNAGYTNVIDLHGLNQVESIGGKLLTN